MSASIDANLERMQRKYGFFLPDQEYLVDAEGLLGYCHEKIKLGHYCLYCQRIFSTYQGCMKHMIAKNHTKLRYERGIDLDEFDPFYDFSEADKEFLSSIKAVKVDSDEDVEEAGAEETSDVDDEEDGWEDVSEDDDAMDDEDERGEQDDDDLYAGYEDEIAKYGFDVTPLGELVFPDGRIIGHRGLARYYRQRHAPSRDRAAVVAARQAAGERLYRGRVYNVQQQQQSRSSALALSRAGISPGTASGRAGQGVLVSSGSGGFTSLSLYRFRAVTRKARRDEARGQRLQHRATMNMNKMDKKGNRLMNGVVVQKALR
jgi:pre-60S factor REI1